MYVVNKDGKTVKVNNKGQELCSLCNAPKSRIFTGLAISVAVITTGLVATKIMGVW